MVGLCECLSSGSGECLRCSRWGLAWLAVGSTLVRCETWCGEAGVLGLVVQAGLA